MFDEFKIGYSHDQVEGYDIIECTAYTYSHFCLVAARSQKMETYKVESCVRGHHVRQPVIVKGSRCRFSTLSSSLGQRI